MEAIITAGLSDKEKCIVKKTPKSFILIDGQTIIEHQVQILKNCGIQRLTIVTGALGPVIQAQISKLERSNMILRVMVNPQYASTGNAFSFLYGLLGIDDDVLYMDEGVLFETRAVQDFIKSSKRLTIGIRKELSKDGMCVIAQNQIVTEMGIKSKKNDVVGEYAGIAQIPQRCLLDLRCKLHTLFKSPYRLVATFEEAIQAAVSSRTKVEWMNLSKYTGGVIRSQKDLKKITADWNSLK